MARKKSTGRIPQILGLTLLIILAFIGWNLLGPQPQIPEVLTRTAEDFKKNPKVNNIIDLTGDKAKEVTEKARATAKEAGKTLKVDELKEKTSQLAEKTPSAAEIKDKASRFSDAASQKSRLLSKEAQQGADSVLIRVSTVWHVDDTIRTLRADPEWLPLGKIPPHARKALLAIEDHEFYSHGALDISGIFRAFLVNLQAGEVRQGGSTLTQQMVKNVFLNNEQTLGRKVEEAALSLWIEHKYTKDEILELYFNSTYFGAGAYGLRDAAQTYFGKEPALLNLPESALLAALPNAPSALNPYENPAGCAKRTRLVLREMMKYGYIGNTEFTGSLAQGVTLKNGRRLLLE